MKHLLVAVVASTLLSGCIVYEEEPAPPPPPPPKPAQVAPMGPTGRDHGRPHAEAGRPQAGRPQAGRPSSAHRQQPGQPPRR